MQSYLEARFPRAFAARHFLDEYADQAEARIPISELRKLLDEYHAMHQERLVLAAHASEAKDHAADLEAENAELWTMIEDLSDRHGEAKMFQQ